MARAHYERNNTAKKEVKAGPITITGWEIFNGTAAVMFVQFFDKILANVTVGTTVPTFVVAIPATSVVARTMTAQSQIDFTLGLVYAVTTEDNNSTAPTFDSAIVTGDVTLLVQP